MKNIVILSALLIAFSVIHEVQAQNQDSSQVVGAKDSTNSGNSDANIKSTFVFSEKPDQKYTLIGPRVKGLSLGMRFQDAIEIAKEKIKGKKALIGEFDVGGPYKTTEGPCGPMLSMAIALGGAAAENAMPGKYYITMEPSGASHIFADKDNAVSQIAFSANLTQALFENTLDSSLKEFAKNFMDAYGIPEFQPSEDGEGYEYTYPEGVKVIINKDKSIEIDKIASKKEIKSSFN
jgi:hypothetical protein